MIPQLRVPWAPVGRELALGVRCRPPGPGQIPSVKTARTGAAVNRSEGAGLRGPFRRFLGSCPGLFREPIRELQEGEQDAEETLGAPKRLSSAARTEAPRLALGRLILDHAPGAPPGLRCMRARSSVFSFINYPGKALCDYFFSHLESDPRSPI